MSFIYDSMRPYQREGAKFGKHFLLADQPGLGKTIQTLAAIMRSARKTTERQEHLVLSPSVAVLNVWEPEVRRWLKDRKIEVVPLTGTLAQREARLTLHVPDADTEHVFFIANIESARIIPKTNPKSGKRDVFNLTVTYEVSDTGKERATGPVLPALFEREWDTVIVDESHRALIRTNGTPSATRQGMVFLGKLAGRRIALSGTPMRGKPPQLWGTLNWLRPDLYRSYWKWVKEFFEVESNGFSNYVIATDEKGNAKFKPGMRKRLAKSLSSIMLRRTKAEVLPDLPPKQYAGTYAIPEDTDSPLGVWLEPTPKMLKQIALLETDAMVLGEEELMVNGSLAYYTRAKQLACGYCNVRDGKLVPTTDSPKFEWLLDWLENSGGEKIVVVSQFTSLLNVYSAALKEKGYNVALLTGETSELTRRRIVQQFQETDEVQVFMLNTQAGGVALTLDAADYLVFLDETTIPDDQEQAEDRIHRASRMHNVTIYYLRTLGTIDEEVAFVAAARANVQSYLLDGARGVEFAKRLYQETKQAA